MERHLQETQPIYINKVQELNQAVFYCYNSSAQRIPVGMVHDFTFTDSDTVLFYTNYFPVVEMQWNSFAAELHFYKKGTTESVTLHGIGIIESGTSGTVLFSIQHVEYAGLAAKVSAKTLLSNLFKPYLSFYKKSSDLLLQPFKRKSTTGVFQ